MVAKLLCKPACNYVAQHFRLHMAHNLIRLQAILSDKQIKMMNTSFMNQHHIKRDLDNKKIHFRLKFPYPVRKLELFVFSEHVFGLICLWRTEAIAVGCPT